MVNLCYYFLSDPKINDSTGALANDAIVHEDEAIIVSSVSDLIAVVMRTMRIYPTGKIKTLTISAHGGVEFFHIGRDLIGFIKDQPTSSLLALNLLAGYFAPDAKVVISACSVARTPGLLKKLSMMWQGVSVKGYTEETADWKWWIFHGFASDGDTVVCKDGECRTNPVEIEPMDLRGLRPG